jgi:hypothetical protein
VRLNGEESIRFTGFSPQNEPLNTQNLNNPQILPAVFLQFLLGLGVSFLKLIEGRNAGKMQENAGGMQERRGEETEEVLPRKILFVHAFSHRRRNTHAAITAFVKLFRAVDNQDTRLVFEYAADRLVGHSPQLGKLDRLEVLFYSAHIE